MDALEVFASAHPVWTFFICMALLEIVGLVSAALGALLSPLDASRADPLRIVLMTLLLARLLRKQPALEAKRRRLDAVREAGR